MSEAAVELRGIHKRYGDVVAVEAMDMAVQSGEFLSFLGPSGCGKTTTLRMIAGLENPSAGDILIKGRRVNDVPIHKRNLGIVFQNYALFPHRSVYDNVAFGLRYRKCSKDEIRTRVRDALRLVQLEAMEERFPAALSGGQQQRVALARAIVINPDLLLLDEPLSALDANLREDMRLELKRIQRETGITTLFITHDQSEALAMSDRIAVMSNGLVEQLDTPQVVYNRPTSRFCANFLGNANVMSGRVVGGEPGAWRVDAGGRLWLSASRSTWRQGDGVAVIVRAEHFQLDVSCVDGEAGNALEACIETVDYLGMSARYILRQERGESLELIHGVHHQPLQVGTRVRVWMPADDVILLPPGDAALERAAP
nr:ABC transporter ATP-binding protein [uncultured Halomonas sp.]